MCPPPIHLGNLNLNINFLSQLHWTFHSPQNCPLFQPRQDHQPNPKLLSLVLHRFGPESNAISTWCSYPSRLIGRTRPSGAYPPHYCSQQPCGWLFNLCFLHAAAPGLSFLVVSFQLYELRPGSLVCQLQCGTMQIPGINPARDPPRAGG